MPQIFGQKIWIRALHVSLSFTNRQKVQKTLKQETNPLQGLKDLNSHHLYTVSEGEGWPAWEKNLTELTSQWSFVNFPAPCFFWGEHLNRYSHPRDKWMFYEVGIRVVHHPGWDVYGNLADHPKLVIPVKIHTCCCTSLGSLRICSKTFLVEPNFAHAQSFIDSNTIF